MSIASKIVLGSIAALALVGYGYLKAYASRYDSVTEEEAVVIRERMKKDLHTACAQHRSYHNTGIHLADGLDALKTIKEIEKNIKLLDKKLENYDAKQAAQQSAE